MRATVPVPREPAAVHEPSRAQVTQVAQPSPAGAARAANEEAPARRHASGPNPLWAVNIVFVVLFVVAALYVASR